MAETSSFEQVIKRDRAARESKHWRGTLLEYLEIVKANPMMTKLSHARIYDMIITQGTRNIHDTDDPRTKRLYKDEPIKVYNFFADEFFGIPARLVEFVRIRPAAGIGRRGQDVLARREMGVDRSNQSASP